MDRNRTYIQDPLRLQLIKNMETKHFIGLHIFYRYKFQNLFKASDIDFL